MCIAFNKYGELAKTITRSITYMNNRFVFTCVFHIVGKNSEVVLLKDMI